MAAITQLSNADFTLDAFLDGFVVGNLTEADITEDATPLAPGDSIGGTPQMTFTGDYRSRWNLAKGKGVTLFMGDQQGTARGIVRADNYDVSRNKVSFTADTLISRLNANVTAKPVVGTVTEAFVYWGDLVGVSSFDIDDDIARRSMIAPGFIGNLWDFLKQVCSAYNYQIYSTGTSLVLTTPGKIELVLDPTASLTMSSDDTQRSQTVVLQNYNLKSTVSNVPFFAATEIYTVGLGEKQENRVSLKGTPFSLLNPTCVNGISTIPYLSGNGEYVVTGADGFIVDPALWNNNGGSITVRMADDAPDEAIITIQGPSGREAVGRAPFSISEGSNRPALYISGLGVLRTAETVTLWTADTMAPEQSVEVDNKAIGTIGQARSQGVLTAQQYAGNTQQCMMSDQPLVVPVQRAYTQYNTFGNLLTDEQAGVGRKRNATEGWSFPPQAFGRVAAGGIQVTYEAKTSDLASFASTQPNTLVPDNLAAYREWLTPVNASTSYTALMRYTRVTGGNTLRLGINWYSASGADLGNTLTNAAAPTTGVSTTMTHTATSPSNAAYARIIVRPGITTTFDFLFEKAQLTVGAIGELDFTDWPEVILTEWFGRIAGSVLRIADAYYRVVSATYSNTKLTLNMVQHTTFEDFDKVWAGKTIADFDAVWDGV